MGLRKGLWLAGILALGVLSGCGNLKMDTDEWEANAAIESSNEQTLLSAKEIQVNKKLNLFRDVYEVEVDGNVIATITGKVVKDFGNEFVLKTEDGKILATEYQMKRTFNFSIDRQGEFKGADGQVTGYMGEKILSDFPNWGLKFHFFDLDEEETGYTEQTTRLKLNKGTSIIGTDGEEEYLVKQDNRIVLPSNYTISVMQDDEDLSVSRIEAIVITAIEDAIVTAKSND